jgi:hypothetical protein
MNRTDFSNLMPDVSGNAVNKSSFIFFCLMPNRQRPIKMLRIQPAAKTMNSGALRPFQQEVTSWCTAKKIKIDARPRKYAEILL